MPKVVIHGIMAVGMLHYDGLLTQGGAYRLKREEDNPHDSNAVAIVELQNSAEARHNLGHLKRDAARLLSEVIDARLSSNGIYYLKVKCRAPVNSGRSGVAQECTAGFLLKTDDEDRAANIVLNKGFRVTYSDKKKTDKRPFSGPTYPPRRELPFIHIFMYIYLYVVIQVAIDCCLFILS